MERTRPVQHELFSIATRYVQSNLRDGGIDHSTVRPNIGRSRAIGEWYDSAVSDEREGSVWQAYQRLSDEVEAQFRALNMAGFKLFETSSPLTYRTIAGMTQDAHIYHGLTVWTGGKPDHGLLTRSRNVMFRFVHDLFGHVMTGADGSHFGEELAYQAHKVMFSPLAQRALATETRGQNCATLFGSKQGNAPSAMYTPRFDTPLNFAPQKALLMPEWAL